MTYNEVLMKNIVVKYDVGEKLIRQVSCGGSVSFCSGIPKKHIIQILEINIAMGNSFNNHQRKISYLCFNETTGKYETLSDKDIDEWQVLTN